MKKALVIFLALAMTCSVFAAEPEAEVKIAEFTGDAAVVFRADLNTGLTGFKNETSGKLKLPLLKGGDKSTTGDGIWGELKIKIDTVKIESKHDKVPTLNDKKVSIETAQIHFGPLYVGLKSGKAGEFGDNYWYPNALNYKDDKDRWSRYPSPGFDGYDQGLVVGYHTKDDKIKVEAGLRSKKDKIEEFGTDTERVVVKKDTAVKEGDYFETCEDAILDNKNKDVTKNSGLVSSGKAQKDFVGYKRKAKAGEKWEYLTNKYAVSLFLETKPIQDLRVSAGIGYAFGKVNVPNWTVQDKDDKHDISAFAGAEFKMSIGEKYTLLPVVTYTMYADAKYFEEQEAHENHYYYPADLKTSMLNTGVHFGWGKEGDNSPLKDFFAKRLAYNIKKDTTTEVGREDDSKVLPGVGLYAMFDLTTQTFNDDVKYNINRNLPVMLTFFSGDLIKDLKIAALFSANVGKDAAKIDASSAGSGNDAYQKLIDARGLQFGTAANYTVKVKDISIIPGFGVLWTHGMFEIVDYIGAKGFADEVRFAASVDVKGAVKNTTFSAFWEDSAYGKLIVQPTGMAAMESYTNNHGKIGLKAKVHF